MHFMLGLMEAERRFHDLLAKAMRDDEPELLEWAADLAETKPALLLEFADTAVSRGRLELAEQLFQVCLTARADTAAGPAPSETKTLLGRLRIRLGKLQGALQVLEEAVAAEAGGYADIQLGNALRYLGSWERAAAHFDRAYRSAGDARDRPLAIAAECAAGELALDQGRPQDAARLFGRALGLTEFLRSEAATVAPLAGLAQAHAAWRNPGKGQKLAERAVARARAAGDLLGECRALLSLGLACGEPGQLRLAEGLLNKVKHEPLRLRIKSARLELKPDPAEGQAALTLAEHLGMRREAERLRAVLALDPWTDSA